MAPASRRLITLLLAVPVTGGSSLVTWTVASGGWINLYRDGYGSPPLSRRARVEIVSIPSDEGGPPEVRVARRAWPYGAGAITLSIGRVPAGTFRVRERSRKGRPGRDLADIHVRAPELTPLPPRPHRPRQRVVVPGRFLCGTHTRVRVGSRRVRVMGWSSPPGVAVKLPRRIADGDYPVTVETAAGSVTSPGVLRVRSELYALSTRDLRPFGALGFDSRFPVSNRPVDVRATGAGTVELSVGELNPDGGFTRLRFEVLDVFDASLRAPTALRAEWASVRQRSWFALASEPQRWFGEGEVILTVQAYDAPSGFLVASFLGSLRSVHADGLPGSGDALFVRGGRVEGYVQRGLRPLRPGASTVPLNDRDIVLSSASTLRIGVDGLEPTQVAWKDAVALTRFIDLEANDPVLASASFADVDADVPRDSALLVEVQAAPGRRARDWDLEEEADTTAASEWLPFLLDDRRSLSDGAFADLGLLRQKIGVQRAFSLDSLNDRGFRLVRFRVRIRMLEPPYVGPGGAGPIPLVRAVRLRFQHRSAE